MQAQQARSDLLKWKLGLVGVIGAIGLGLAGTHTSHHAALVLCVLPLVCVYVDLLCRHLSLRMLVIAAFIKKRDLATAEEPLVAYERFVGTVRTDHEPFALETWALDYSTAAVSAFVFAYGIAGTHNSTGVKVAFLLSGAMGGLFTFLAGRAYLKRSGALIALAAAG
ncbi:MAG TPA: hypothetical protein VGH09_06595 [Solirubrobacteraceae bacterium]